MSRRTRGEGSVFESPPDSGRWFFQSSHYDAAGRRRRETRGPLASRQAAAAAGRKLAREREAGRSVAAERQALADYLEHWLTHVVAPTTRPRTHAIYAYQVRSHIVPRLGGVRLAALTPQHIREQLLNPMAEILSPATVAQARRVLHTALEQAKHDDLILRNPVEAVRPPRQPRQARRSLSVDEARRLLERTFDDRLAALYATTLAVGLRRGEVVGLRWADVDLELGWLLVHQQLQRGRGEELKTASSGRAVPLPLFASKALEVHRDRQARERGAAGDVWEEHGLVFTTRLGRPLSADNVGRAFRAHVRAAGLPAVRFHDLRHTTTSLLAELGVAPRTVQRIVGHANVATTLGVYTHARDEQLVEALGRLDAALGGGA